MAPLLKNVRRRIIFFAALWVPIFCCFVWRAYHLQITRHDELREKAQKKYSSKVKIVGRRGEIFDKEQVFDALSEMMNNNYKSTNPLVFRRKT